MLLLRWLLPLRRLCGLPLPLLLLRLRPLLLLPRLQPRAPLLLLALPLLELVLLFCRQLAPPPGLPSRCAGLRRPLDAPHIKSGLKPVNTAAAAAVAAAAAAAARVPTAGSVIRLRPAFSGGPTSGLRPRNGVGQLSKPSHLALQAALGNCVHAGSGGARGSGLLLRGRWLLLLPGPLLLLLAGRGRLLVGRLLRPGPSLLLPPGVLLLLLLLPPLLLQVGSAAHPPPRALLALGDALLQPRLRTQQDNGRRAWVSVPACIARKFEMR